MTDFDQYKSINNSFFNKLLSEGQGEHASVGWSETSQHKRLVKICELGDFNDKSILDVGCGLGTFYDFLKVRNSKFQYAGWDINENMIKRAQELHPEAKSTFVLKDLLEENDLDHFDYVICNGTLNLFLNEEINYSMTFQMMSKMFEISKIGFAMCMTSSFSKKKKEDTFYYDPEKIINYLKRFCNNFKVDHSYFPHDFTVFCYKEDFYSSFR